MGKSQFLDLVAVPCICALPHIERNSPSCGDIPRAAPETPRGRVRPRLPLGPLYVVLVGGAGGEASGRRITGSARAPRGLALDCNNSGQVRVLVFAASNGANVRTTYKIMARVIVALLLTAGAALQQPGPRPRAPTAKNAVPCAEADALMAQAKHLRTRGVCLPSLASR